MAKKVDLSQMAKKVENIANKVNLVAQNKLIIAILLIVDGITFILNPDTTLEGMARNIILLVLLAAFSVFITNLIPKEKNVKTIVISLVILALGTLFYIFPYLIAAYIQLLLSLFIIYNGAANIANALNLNWLSKITKFVKKKFDKQMAKEKASQKEEFKDIDNNLNEGLEQQKEKLLNPIHNIIGKTSGHSVLFVIINAVSIIFGLILLIFPDTSMTVWGLIFLYTGGSNLLVAARTMNLMKKIKERKFKEILFDKKSH